MNSKYLDKHWTPIYNKRLEWAYSANERFINNIKSDLVKNKLGSDPKKDISICTIGPSQVGKTSLILKLLGIKEEKFSELSEKLRGGSTQGNSATATAMIYTKSVDDSFYYIEDDNEEEHTLDSLDEKLADLRKRVENKKNVSNEKPIHIKIAKDYFEEDADFSLRIIDLPGKGSSNKKEEEHVDAILSRYSSIATTIIFVSNIKQIKGLQDLIDSYSFTKYYPEKCKAVLTFSFSADSVETELDSLLEKKGLKLDTFKNIIEKELTETFSDDFEKYDFFPLEYGDSLETKLKDCQTHEQEIIKEILNTILSELKEKIQESSSEYSKLMQNNKLPKKIQELIREKNEESKQINVKITNDVDHFGKQRKTTRDEIGKLQKQLDETNEEFKKLPTLENVQNALIKIKKVNHLYLQNYHYVTTRTQVSSIIKDMLGIFKKDLVEEIEKIGKFGVPINIEDDLKNITYNFENYFKKQNYWKDEYNPSISDNFGEDQSQCRKYIDKCIQSVNKKIEDSKKNHISNKNKIKEKLEHLRHYNQDTKAIIIKKQEAIENELREFSKRESFFNIEQSEVRKEIEKLEKDKKNAESFFEILTESYVEEKKRISQIEINSSKEKKFFQFMNLALLNREYKKLEAEKK